jgi:hypothetical protein
LSEERRLIDAAMSARGAFVVALLAALFAGLALATAAPAQGLPEGRELELVSPFDDALVEEVDVLPYGRPSDDGNAIAYQVFGFLNNGPSDLVTTYVARRGADQWNSTRVSPSGTLASGAGRERNNWFFQFTPDLSAALLGNDAPGSTPTVPGEPTGFNLYRRQLDTGPFELITQPAPVIGGRPSVMWASSDLQHAVIDYSQSSSSSTAGVYAWSAEDGISLVSAGAKAGDSGSVSGGEGFGAGVHGGGYRTISDDGSRIFYSTNGGVGPFGNSAANLWVRRDHGTPGATSVQVDAPEPGAPGGTGAWYRTASPDGSKVLFSSCARLTTDSTASGGGSCSIAGYNEAPDPDPDHNVDANWDNADLYIYDENGNGPGNPDLVDITTGDPDGAGVLGVLGTSDNLNRVYFVAAGDLDGAGPAPDNEANVYLWDKASGITFIATVSRGDLNPSLGGGGGEADRLCKCQDADLWLPPLGEDNKEARVSPDGRHLAFVTHRNIDGSFDNNYTTDDPRFLGEAHKQLYHWKIGMNEPRCVSCVGSGPSTADVSFRSLGGNSRPLDASQGELEGLPSFSDWQHRNLLDDGSRIYFETEEQLVPEDDNSGVDVYQYDTVFDRLHVISGGQGGGDANFAGATPNGSDVFFRTRNSLVFWDDDGNADLYDARIGGGQPAPPAPPEPCPEPCAPPGSQTHTGPGNGPVRDVNKDAAARGGKKAKKKCKGKKKGKKCKKKGKKK